MKNKFTGVMNVFRFAYKQSVKTKAFVVSLVILCTIALLAFPVTSLFTGQESDNSDESKAELIGTIYIEDGALDGKLGEGLKTRILDMDEYSDKEIVLTDEKDHEDTINKVKESESGDVLVQITFIGDVSDMDYGFEYVVFYGDEKEDLDSAGEYLSGCIDELHEQVLADIFIEDKGSAQFALYNYSMVLQQIDANGNVIEDDSSLDMAEYGITYAFLMVSIFAISIGGGKVAEQIVTEKSSKVIEYIMTSIKPMALITGKVLASIATVLTMVVAVVLSLFASALINGMLFKAEDGSMMIPDTIKFLFDGSVMTGANIVNIIIAALIFVLGLVLYGFIAGIAGATVSKVEEMAEGIKLFTFAMLIGAYVCIALIMTASTGGGDWGAVTNVIYLFPLTSVFIVPAYILLGKVSAVIGILSVLIMIVCIFLLMIFVSGIYEYLIYYNGSPLKFKDLIGIFRNKRRAE